MRGCLHLILNLVFLGEGRDPFVIDPKRSKGMVDPPSFKSNITMLI